jgi:hypothetical protein
MGRSSFAKRSPPANFRGFVQSSGHSTAVPPPTSPGKLASNVRQIEKWLSKLRLDSIRSQILAFAILAALIPALAISLIAYAQSRRALTEKITQELVTTGSQAAREADVWLKERLYDLRVFANSSIVSAAAARGGRPQHLAEYLNSVGARFPDYEELQLIDARGELVASSAPHPTPVRLPEGWGEALVSSRSLVGEPYRDQRTDKVVVVIGVPVLQGSGRVAGALVARTNFASFHQILRAFGTRWEGRVYLATERGAPIADSRGGAGVGAAAKLSPEMVQRLLAAEGRVVEHRGVDGAEVLGSTQRLSQATWFAGAYMPVDVASFSS